MKEGGVGERRIRGWLVGCGDVDTERKREREDMKILLFEIVYNIEDT